MGKLCYTVDAKTTLHSHTPALFHHTHTRTHMQASYNVIKAKRKSIHSQNLTSCVKKENKITMFFYVI